MIAETIEAKTGFKADKRQLDLQPLRALGEHKVHVRLTLDLIPVVKVLVYREGETPEAALAAAAQAATAAVAQSKVAKEVVEEEAEQDEEVVETAEKTAENEEA
jgi:hypothetical protein